MNPVAADILMHYGIKYRSGRYPYGSGENPYQHSGDFLSRVEQLQKSGMKETEIAEKLGLTTGDLRIQMRVAKHERRQILVDRAKALQEDGKNPYEIARIMGYSSESSVRSLLNTNTAAAKNAANRTAEILKKELETKGMLDVSAGVERELGVSRDTLKEAVFILTTQGYANFGVGMKQTTNSRQQTNTEVIAKVDPKDRKLDDVALLKKLQKQIYDDPASLKPVGEYHSDDSGLTFTKLQRPSSLDGKRVGIRYGDEGGSAKDGVIELRRGVPDLDLGNSHYAQVRILVDGTHYLKGMAMYSDDLPDGVDVMFNTNKKSGTPREKVFKKVEPDPDNPFGAALKANGQSMYKGKDGKEHLSPINKLKEEGDWDSMSRNLSSQFLSKQPVDLIKRQLDLTRKDCAAEYDEIKTITNPTVKKKLLLDFADQCDSAAVHMKAAALPRQSTQVILPVTKMKDTEVFAPGYSNGERVALVRYPHAGTFEIPILKVNNNDPNGKRVLGKEVKDAIGINPKVAERLSGADFDGDQVVVIPLSGRVKVKSTAALEGLKDFDPKIEYSTEGYTTAQKKNTTFMTKKDKQKQMGVVSNLITDMTLKGAPLSDIEKAVRHSMVVIDAEKHKLDYKKSEKDNDIATLKQRWQGREVDGQPVGGASTLISRRKQTVNVPERRGSAQIDPDTGKVSYKESGRTYIDPKTGDRVRATTKVSLISQVDDLRTLSSGTEQENLYADHGNRLKAMANQARKDALATGNIKKDSNATQVYQAEVDSLRAKLNDAAKNAPRERYANRIANSQIKAKIQDNPELSDKESKKELKKAQQIAIENARYTVSASGKNTRINITEKEWEAIQAGAISSNQLSQILRYADMDVVREMATPRSTTTLSTAKQAKVNAMRNSGYTLEEIAKAVGVSRSTISKYIK